MAQRRPRRLNRDRVLAILILTPSIIAVGIFVYAFIAWTGWASLLKWNDLKPLRSLPPLPEEMAVFPPDVPAAGLDNYTRLFTADQRFPLDVRNTIAFTVFFIIVCLAIGMVLAVLLDRRIRGEGVFRGIFLFPMAVSFIVTGVVWRWLLNPRAGVNILLDGTINPLLVAQDQPPIHPDWFTSPDILFVAPNSTIGQFLSNIGLGALATPQFGIPVAMLSVVIAAAWQMSGYTMALYLAGLRSIPDELREAARVDGANEWQVFRHITLPLLNPVTLSAVIILGHISLKIFDLISSMTGPGPGFATDVPAYYMFDTVFRGNHFARGASIAIILLLMVSVLVVPYLLYSRRREVQAS